MAKKNFIKKLTATLLTLSLLPCIPFSASAAVEKVMVDQYKNYKQTFTYVDMRGVVNRGFADDAASDGVGGWADQGPLNDMSCYKDRGVTEYLGVKFDIIEPNSNGGKSAIVLRGQNDQTVPLEVEVPVNEKCAGVYFLHASPWLSAKEDVGSYTFVYEDGTEHEMPVSGGDEVFNWWGHSESENAIIGWEDYNDSSLVSLAIFPVQNPYPDKKITKIVAKTIGVGPYLCIAGITLTDAGPYLPQIEKVDIGNPDTTGWYAYTPCEDSDIIAGSPIDMSRYLDAPAGKHGYINAKGEDLVFDDGTDFNVWGLNISYRAWYPDYDEAEKNAKRIAQMGFNTCRFHIPQMGSDIYAGVDNLGGTTRRSGYVSKRFMDRFCYFIYCLKKEGIYIGMDLTNTAGTTWKDNNFQDEEKLGMSTRGPNFFDEEVIKLNDKIAENILSYYNPYTGMTIGEDPCLLWASLYNESGIFMATNFEEWDYYYPRMNKLYNEWLLKKYPTRAALEAAWADPLSDNMALEEDEDQTLGTVKLYAAAKRKRLNDKRHLDNVAFLADMQETNFKERFETVRQWAPRAMLQGSTLFTAGYEDRPSHYSNMMQNDFISMQSYFYLLTGNGEHLQYGTKVSGTPAPTVKDRNLHNFKVFVASDTYGIPYLQTEWDAGMPNPYRSELNLMMGAWGAFHNWGPVLFVWDHTCEYNSRVAEQDSEKFPLNQHSLMDRPEAVHAFPSIAQMYLRGDITPATKSFYPMRFRGEEVYHRSNQTITLDPTFAWSGKSGALYDNVAYDESINDNEIAKMKLHGDKTGRYISHTDEIMLDVNEGLYLINTENTQAAAGFVDRVELNDVIFEVENEFSTVTLSSLSETENIHNTDSMLLTLVGDARPITLTMNETCTEFLSNCEGPMIIEPIVGTFTIKNKNRYKVYSIGYDGQRKAEISTERTEEGYTKFTTSIEDQVMNYEIVRVSKAQDNPENEKISFIKEVNLGDLFTDLGEYEPYKKEIERTFLQGYVKEVAPGRIAPEQSVSRGQAVSLINTLLGFAGETENPFTDIDDTHPYYKAAVAAYVNGYVKGDASGSFRPDEPVSREDFFVVLKNALDKSLKKRTKNPGETVSYSDYDEISSYAKSSIDEMIRLGYTENRNTFNPQANLTRGDLCIAVYNILWK
ncbi:MAG: S-layer homology domain-containing protein [Ruminococcaceae bacterium]|nr:S-layer homology domain-containing protein [Oscillospiraceae bacterium]